MRLLLHMCCANCSLYPVKHLTAKGIALKGLWFNPNIHPEEEYGKRLDALKTLQTLWGLDIEYIDHYGLEDFLRSVEDKGEDRCAACYRMRLKKTASAAKEMGLDGFTTTLLVSPYQKFDLIAEAAREAEEEHSIPFYFEDMRPGWREGARLSKELGLYRQKYCGCIFSKKEREEKESRRPEFRALGQGLRTPRQGAVSPLFLTMGKK
ncbi:MAG: epoxyqueuosine reductase QueH [Thermodesulfovibrionales bacterium]|nr:epoxyqueuosine reductase QueH [Thermodesulfovibrionales bacterium]